jgi:hypothetical protein
MSVVCYREFSKFQPRGRSVGQGVKKEETRTHPKPDNRDLVSRVQLVSRLQAKGRHCCD